MSNFANYTEVLAISTGGYEWIEMRVYRKGRGKWLYALTDSGCSCNWWNRDDHLSVSGMITIKNLNQAKALFFETFRYYSEIKWEHYREKFAELGLR